MKTAMTELKERLIEIGFAGVEPFIDEYILKEKQQHEQTAIHITNILMDALDNPKGGKFSVEDEFNKYWDNKYTTNK